MGSNLIEILVQEKLLTKEQLESALDYQKKNKVPLASALIALVFISEEALAQVLSQKLGLPYVDLDQFEIYPDVISLIDLDIVQKYRIIPLHRIHHSLTLAMVDPTDFQIIEDIRFRTGLSIQPVIVTESSIKKAIDKYYGGTYALRCKKIIDEAELDVMELDEKEIEDFSFFKKRFEIIEKEAFKKKTAEAEIPQPITDHVNFTVTSLSSMMPGKSYLLDVWAHLDAQRQEVIRRAREAYKEEDMRIETKGPVRVVRGSALTVHLAIPDFIVKYPEDIILWVGQIGNARFQITVPENTSIGRHDGLITFYLDGIQIAMLHFNLEVSFQETGVDQLETREQRIRSAFASYASEDRDRVAARIQGIMKVLPDLDLFWDVVSLRSGELWKKRLKDEILRRDIFYLFWSLAASRSKWVKIEWQTALKMRGIRYIDPVPLDPPDVAPPPKKLAKLHFNAWELAYTRRYTTQESIT